MAGRRTTHARETSICVAALPGLTGKLSPERGGSNRVELAHPQLALHSLPINEDDEGHDRPCPTPTWNGWTCLAWPTPMKPSLHS
jgi:hypothetical protein